MDSSDTLQRFIFEHAEIRGEIARLDETYQTIIHQREYPPSVKKLLGEALVSCLLLVGSIKFEGELSLQFQGNHALPMMIIQCDHLLNLRGFARFKEGLNDEDYRNAFLKGQMSFLINQSHQTEIYQSIIPISSSNMSENLMNFFAQSEQVATQINIAINEQHVVGMLLQLLPGQDTEQREEFWQYATVIGQTVTNEELLTLENEEILHRLYHETDIRLLLEKEAKFKCRCNNDKMISMLKMFGEEEVRKLLDETGKIDITCDFCNQHYYFDSIDVEMLFRQIN
jgi:molecular chaperone Hsp33